MIIPGSPWQVPVPPRLHLHVIDRALLVLDVHVHPDRFRIDRQGYGLFPLRVLDLPDLCPKDGFHFGSAITVPNIMSSRMVTGLNCSKSIFSLSVMLPPVQVTSCIHYIISLGFLQSLFGFVLRCAVSLSYFSAFS